MKLIYLKILVVLALVLGGEISFAQNCYTIMDQLAGFEQESPILEQAACSLLDSLPQGFQEDFKILHSGLYLHNTKMQGGNEQFYEEMQVKAASLSSYYLIMAHQVYEDGHSEYYVDIKLPEDWLSNCYNQLIIHTFKNSIKAKFKSLQVEYSLATEYQNIEIEGMKYIAEKLGAFTSCCLYGDSYVEESCTSCITAYDILNELEPLGFEAYYAGQVMNSDPNEDQYCLCTENSALLVQPNKNKSLSTIIDNANFIFELDGIEYNFGEELNIGDSQEGEGYITKNTNYCDEIGFQEIQTSFNNSEKAVWVHLWENPLPEEADIVFIKIKTPVSTPISGQMTLQADIPDVPTSPPPSHKFRIVHRTFAPWDRFGSFPIWYNVHRARNNFHGDNRGFSLGETMLESGVTARIHQEANIQLGVGEIAETNNLASAFSSITKGYTNFQQTKYIHGSILPDIPPTIPLLVPVEESEAFGNPESNITTNVEGDWTNIEMAFEGNVPLIKFFRWPPLFAPDIEWGLGLSLASDDTYIYVSGVVEGRAFPAYEAFIEDFCGEKIFLHTFTAPCESSVGFELLNPFYDYERRFNFIIEVDSQGCFRENMSINSGETFISIEEWNIFNLSKQAAVDCPSNPCQGAYPNDGSDLREQFNCGDYD